MRDASEAGASSVQVWLDARDLALEAPIELAADRLDNIARMLLEAADGIRALA